MAGSLTLQRVPRGLLDALGMRGSGALPAELGQQVMSIVDTTWLYLADNVKTIATSVVGINNDLFYQASSGVVPAGELWIVNNLTASVSNVGAGTNFTMQAAWKRGSTNGLYVVGQPVVVPVNGDGVAGYQFAPWELVLYPADYVGIVTTNGTYGLNPTATINIDVYRLEV